MADVSDLVIRGDGADLVRISVLRRSHPQATDYWDGNWINVDVEIHAGRFRGKYSASFRTTDFAGLEADLQRAYGSLDAAFEFAPLEEQLKLRFKGDGLGHFVAECRAQDEAGTGNVLEFFLGFDQTRIPEMLASLKSINSAFPIRAAADHVRSR